MNDATSAGHADTAQLAALGYTADFDRTMSKWENFSLGFTYLSPVVGVYSVFAFAIVAGGPAMWWSYPLAGLGQLLVALVFGEVVSQFPISGGLYPWARRLVGRRWAWLTGWVYGWALAITIAAVATGVAPFLAQLFGFTADPVTETLIAILMIGLSTLLNLSGTRFLARVALTGFVCELVGAVAVGGYLLIFARHQPLAVLASTQGIGGGAGYLPAFLAAAEAGLFTFFGFEACGDVAEETPDPGRTIPQAMLMTIYVGGASAMLVCLALILAIPDLPAVLDGSIADPVAEILRAALGEVGFRAVICVVLISFVSCLLSLQAAASRLLFAYARDEMILGSGALRRLTRKTRVPGNALLVMGVLPSGFALAGLLLPNALATIVAFSVTGIYIAFQMLVLGALIARARGWRPGGAFRLGRWGLWVNLAALAYGVAAILDMAWPRMPDDPWYSNYAVLLTGAAIVGLGIAYMALGKPYSRGAAPAGDAHRLAKAADL
jgi:amino acid transporter